MSNHMIYISKALDDKFSLENNKGGLVNALLSQYYGMKAVGTDKGVFVSSGTDKKFEFCKHDAVKGLCKKGC